MTRWGTSAWGKVASSIKPRHMYQTFKGWDKRLIQKDLKIKLEEDLTSANAYLDIQYSKWRLPDP